MKWEYRIVYFSAVKWSATGMPPDLGQRFDEYGAEGWELVRTEPILTGGLLFAGFGTATRTAGFIAFFKRPYD